MILFAANDAGPAAYLAEIIKRIDEPFVCISSPVSAKIFDACGVKNTPCVPYHQSGYDEFVEQNFSKLQYDVIVTGTSWGDCIDKAFIRFGLENKIRVISIIEHWSWYRERFLYEGCVMLPDSIVVNDELAKEEAVREGLPEKIMHALGNPALENKFRARRSDFDKKKYMESLGVYDRRIITFISEDYSRDFPENSEHYNGFDEYGVVGDLLDIIRESEHLVIKLHPAEHGDKYYRCHDRRITVISQTDQMLLIASSDFIIGMGSMFLLEAALVRNDIISYRPPGDRKEFVGNKIGATSHVSDKKVLRDILDGKTTLNNRGFGHKFMGSTDRIIAFLKERMP